MTATRSSIKVLLVDAIDEDRKQLTAGLRRAGFLVWPCAPADAVETARNHTSHVHLIALNESAREGLIDDLRRINPEARTAALVPSSAHGVALRLFGIESSVKPVTPEVAADLIDRTLRSLDEIIRDAHVSALRQADGNKTHAAAHLGIRRQVLQRRMKTFPPVSPSTPGRDR